MLDITCWNMHVMPYVQYIVQSSNDCMVTTDFYNKGLILGWKVYDQGNWVIIWVRTHKRTLPVLQRFSTQIHGIKERGHS